MVCTGSHSLFDCHRTCFYCIATSSYQLFKNNLLNFTSQFVYRRNWYAALDILESHPHSKVANFVDRYKRCPLHWACIKGASGNFLNILIENFPQATITKDYLGRNPIHLACEFNSDHTIMLLLESTVDLSRMASCRDNKFLRSVLAEAVENSRSPLIINAILQANEKQIRMKDFQGNTPLISFYRKNLGRLLASHSGIFDLVVNVDDLMEIASILLKAEVMEVQKNNELVDSTSMLSCAIKSAATPFSFIDYIMTEMPSEGDLRDLNGDLPIHVACGCRNEDDKLYKCDGCGTSDMAKVAYYFNYEAKSLRQVLCEDCKQRDETNYTRICPGQKSKRIIASLLDQNESHASARSCTGSLPLMIALKSGQTWDSVERLTRAYPTALSQRDEGTGLHPYQLAAIDRSGHHLPNARERSLESLNTIFQLLLIWPMSDKTASS